MNKEKKILLISEYILAKRFLLPVVKKLSQETKLTFDCLLINRTSQSEILAIKENFDNIFYVLPTKYIERIPKIKTVILLIKLILLANKLSTYNIIHINYLHSYLLPIIGILRKKCNKFFITFYGSDFNQIKGYQHMINKFILKNADGVFVTENKAWLKKILKKYDLYSKDIYTDNLFPLKPSFLNFRFYLDNNNVKDAKHALKIEKPIITCGYNGAKITRHKEIVKVLIQIQNKLSNFKILFPMAYGNEIKETRFLVKKELNNTSIDYLIMEEYLEPNQIHVIRLASDIFIHVQSRDQMASSMLEYLAAGNIVITGKWLPYSDLIKLGIYFVLIDSIEDLGTVLLNVIENMEYYKEKTKNNRELVLNMMDWKNIKINWIKYCNV